MKEKFIRRDRNRDRYRYRDRDLYRDHSKIAKRV